jgi:hypothetical protein
MTTTSFDLPPPLEKNSFLVDELITEDLRTHSGSTVRFSVTSLREVVRQIADTLTPSRSFDDLIDKRAKMVRRLCGEDVLIASTRKEAILFRMSGLEDHSESARIRAHDSRAMIEKIALSYKIFNGGMLGLSDEDYQDLVDAYDV